MIIYLYSRNSQFRYIFNHHFSGRPAVYFLIIRDKSLHDIRQRIEGVIGGCKLIRINNSKAFQIRLIKFELLKIGTILIFYINSLILLNSNTSAISA